MTCPTCGAVSSKIARMGALEAHDDPPAAFWRGLRIRITATDATVLFMLVRRGFVSVDAILDRAPKGGEDRNIASVRICRIRKALREAHVPATIAAEYGVGYRLTVEPA